MLVLLVSAVLPIVQGTLPRARAGGLPCESDPVRCPSLLQIGVAPAGLPTSTSGVDAFTAAVGKSPRVLMYFQSFRDGFDVRSLRSLTAAGRLPMVTWEPFDHTVPTQNTFPLRSIAGGTYDAYLRDQAQAVASVGAPIAIRFGHEMNGSWYPWGLGVGGNTAADFIAAYRHVHDVFSAAGVTNVVWVWAPNLIDFNPSQDLAALYPGDTYVDWVGLSGYFDEPTDTFASLYPPTIKQFDRIAPTKPIYVAETSVLPGPTRPAMIADLVGGILRLPRSIGFTWFEHVKRFDWRITPDPVGSAALGKELASPWFASVSPPSPGGLPPLSQSPPAVSGTATVGLPLTGSSGGWRLTPEAGPASYGAQWLRCTDATTLGSCTAASSVLPFSGTVSLTLTNQDVLRYVRLRVTATNSAGSASATSPATSLVLTVPSTPPPPVVEARDGAARLAFPVPPAGTTGWRLVFDGVARTVVPVGTTQTWLTGLTNGRSYGWALQAVCGSGGAMLSSAPVSGTVVPMPAPGSPYVRVDGTVATFSMPRVPTGAATWVLTIDGAARPVSTTAATYAVTGLRAGVRHSWTLQAGAGSVPGQPWGALTPGASGSFVPIPAPAAPGVRAGDASVTFTFPPVPVGATAWKVVVGAVTHPLVPTSAATFTATGLRNGYSTSYSVRAVNGTVSSTAVSGTVTPVAG